MNNLILYPLVLLLFLSVFYQLIYFESADLTYNETLTVQGVNASQYINGTETEFVSDIDSGFFDINMVTGFLVLVLGLVVVGVVAGIRILGSGLSEYSVNLIHKSVVYYGIWGVLSAIGYGVFLTFPYGFGVILWFGLTFVYTLGFFQTLEKG